MLFWINQYNLRVIILNCLSYLMNQSAAALINENVPSIARASNLGAFEVTKRICNRVKQIMDQIHQASKRSPDININLTSENLINFSMERLLIRWYWLDKIFSSSYVDNSVNHKWKDMISLVVYDEDNNIEFANEAYLKATWLNSIEEITELSKKWELYNEIYEWKNLENVIDHVTRLIPKWYTDKVFTMKKTGKRLRWNSKKNVRVWIDVTDIRWHENILACLDSPVMSSFKYNELFSLFNIQYNQIVETVPWLDMALEKAWINKELEKNFERLKKLSLIGDIVINFWPLPIFFTHDIEMFLNKRYIEMSWYDYSELYAFMNTWTLWDKLFWAKKFDELANKISALKVWENLNEMCTITRKWWAKIDVLWNIHKFNEKWSVFWSWIITSPINKDWEEIVIEDLKWASYFDFENEIDSPDDIIAPKDFFS